jgi:hypothetical protein
MVVARGEDSKVMAPVGRLGDSCTPAVVKLTVVKLRGGRTPVVEVLLVVAHVKKCSLLEYSF